MPPRAEAVDSVEDMLKAEVQAGIKGLAGDCQHDLAAAAFKQLDPEKRLQAANLMAQRAWADE